jgi:hypothetical protein
MEYSAHNYLKTFRLKMKCKIQVGIGISNYGTWNISWMIYKHNYSPS